MKPVFKKGERIRVTQGHELESATGRVVRRHMVDNAFWVSMDAPPPPALRRFPPDDELGREDHILLPPSHLEAIE